MPLTEDEDLEVVKLWLLVRDEHGRVMRTGNREDERYWQGKKDGMRIVMTIVAPTKRDRDEWELLHNSSPGGGKSTQVEILEAQVEEAWRILDNFLDLGVKKYPEMRREATGFIDWVNFNRSEQDK